MAALSQERPPHTDKLVTALAAGSGPDVGRFKDWRLGEFVKLKAPEPLPTYIASGQGRPM